MSIKQQKLFYLNNGFIVKEYKISSSKYGVGSASSSKKTPTGLHKVHSRQGKGTPIGGVIKSGKFSGEITSIISQPIAQKQDFVTTRVFRLTGEEHGINKGPGVDSYKRAIYIHGTPEEGLIGKPASHGCIRMKNTEIVELFEIVPNACYVLILDI